MGEVIDRGYLLTQKYLRLKEEYGHDHAIGQFSQAERDEMFNYAFISSRTVENLRAAKEAGHPMGSHIIPKSLKRS